MVSELFNHIGDEHLLSVIEKVSFHRHPLEKKEGSRDRPIKIQFLNQKDRDSFIHHVRHSQACRLSGSYHAFVRRDLTMEELEVDRSMRREAGKRNAEVGQLEFVVRDLRIVRLSNPRPLPPRSQEALNRSKTSSATQIYPVSANRGLSPSFFPTLSHPPTTSRPRVDSTSSMGEGRGRGGKSRETSRGRGRRGGGGGGQPRPHAPTRNHSQSSNGSRKRPLSHDPTSTSPTGPSRGNKVMSLSALSPIVASPSTNSIVDVTA